jgi:hypothetical protein
VRVFGRITIKGEEMKPWLVWDSGNGNIEEYDTEEEALKFAAESLDTYREEAKDDGEWSDEVEFIAVYKLAHNVQVVDSGEAGKDDFTDWVEYGIVKTP